MINMQSIMSVIINMNERKLNRKRYILMQGIKSVLI